MQTNFQQKNLPISEVRDLISVIDKNGLECLNQNDDHPIQNAIFDMKSTTYCKSDCDEQLLIKITFVSAIKLNNIQITSLHTSNAPNSIKLYANNPHLDFDVCENTKPTQELTNLKQEKNVLSVDTMKFQKVTHLAIYIVNNHGGEYTSINNLILFGSVIGGSDIKDWKPVKG